MSTPEPGEKTPSASWLPLIFVAPMALVALLGVVTLILVIWQRATAP